MLKERVLMKNLQIKMEDNVQYKIETPDGRTTTWDAQKWQSKGSELMAKYPDAKVISIRNADKDTQFDDNSFVGIELSDGRTTTWDAQKWRSKGSELMAKYPDAKLSSLTDEAYNYNAKRAEEQRAALADFDNANSSFFKSHEADSLIASEGGAVGANYDAEEERYNTLKAQREKMVADYSANPAVRNDYTSNAKYADYIADSYKRKMQDLRDANRMSTAATAMYSGGIRENEDYHYYEQAYKLAKDASKAYAAPVARQKNGFSEYLSDMGKGAGKTFSDIDFWSRGLSAIDRNRNVRGIIQSLLDKGINVNTATESELRDVLTPGQVELLSAFALNAQAQADRSMTTARGYNAGITAAESLGFMAEFLLTGGIANSAGMAGREASTGLGRLLSRELMRGGSESAIRNGVTRSMINSFSKAGRLSSGAKKATKIASEVASKGYGYVVRPLEGAVLHTALHPSTYREISNSLTQINDSGELVKAGDVIGNTILDQLVENWSEMTGRPIDDLLGVPLKAAGALGKSQKFGHTTLGQWGKMLADSRAANIIQDAGFNGLIGEMGEEWIGNAARVALGIMSKDDFEKFASAESQIDMAASFAPMTLFGLGTSSYQASKQAKQYNKIAQSMRGVLNRQGMSEDEIANIMDVKHTKEEISQALAPVLNKIVRNSNDNNTSYEDYITTLKFAQAIAAQEVLGVAQTVERTRARQQEREDIAMQLGAMPKEVTDENGQKRTSYLEDPRGNISYEKLVSTPEGDFSVEVVTTATDSEGSYYVIEDENSDILMLKNQMDISRQPRLMSREEFNDAVENGEMSTETSAVGDYLDTRINARMEEQRRQALREQSNDALQNIMRHIKPGNVVNFGTNDNPQNGEVLAIDNDGAVVDFGQPTALNGATLQIHRVSLEQLGNILGIDASVRDEQQIDEEQAERDLENEDRVKSLNEQLRDVQFTRDGELFTFVRMFQAPQTNEQGEEVAHIVATNDKGEDVEVDVSLDDLFASRDEEGQPSLPEATQEPRSDNELIDIRGNVIPLRNNEATGQQEVDKRAFKERDPEAYYAWNDGRRGGNVQDSMQALNADMTAETARLAELEKLLETETDPDTRDDVQKQIDEHENKYNLYASIYQKYDAQTDYQNKQLEFLERFAEVNNELAKAKTQEQIDALVKIKSDLMRNYVAETINGATRIESAKNVIALQNAIGAVADTPFSVITEASVEEAMRKDGASEESINKVLAKLAEVSDIRIRTGKKFYATGFYNAGKVYVFVEGNTSEDRAIQTYYHERQHLLNAKDSRAINEVLSLADSNKDSLLQALGLLIGNTTAYHGANVKELADEIVAFGLERASIDKDFRQELRDKGISEGLINILYNEYAKQHGLSDSNTIRQEDGNADVDSSNTGDSKQDADFERAASGDGQLDAAQLSADAGVDGGEQQEDVNTDAVSDHAGSGAEAINQVLAIEEQRKVVDTDPTEAQKEAGNYRMGHVRIDGLDISIENPRGSTRKGIDADGHEWQTEMHNDYGYIRGTKAVDDDHIDVFLSDNPTKGNVYVIDQVDPKTGEFDESKVMYGFDSEQDASEAYLSNYEDGWQGLGKITEVSKEEFKKWIDSSTRKTKPFSEYASVKAAATKKENTTDNQGNPVNEDGTLKIDKIKSIDDLTDEDFRKYTERRAKENEERAKEERKQRLLSQPTRMDEAFGLIPVKDIKTAADITSNIEKITSILADNEKGITDADHPLSSYGGFIYGHNFLFNAQKQVENYVRSLDVIDSKITDEWKATTGIDNVEKLADYVKDLYKAKQTEIKPIVNGSAIYDQSYEKKNSVSDNTTDTVETDGSGKRNDTAIPQNTVSDGEGKQSSETKQISKEENRAPRIKKVNPFDFAIKEKNTQRPIFKGVYHDKGMLVATDTSILIAMKDDYPKELEGAVTFKDGHVTADVKFPDWRAIFDKKSTGEQTKVDITLDKLASYLDKIKADVPKKILTDEDRKASFVVIDFGYGVSSAYNYEYLVKFVNAARYLNAQVSYCSTGGSSWNSLNKKLIAEGTNGKVALFPVKYESEKNYKFNYNIPLNEAGETHFSIAELSSEEISNEQNKHKKAQLDIINATNPMHDDYHTGIREVGDIMTLFEAVEEAKTEDEDELSSYPDVPDDVLESALESGKITVYSSKPIKNGEFVTPSRMNAKDFAGSGTIYEKTVPIKDVAWINTDEGQYAKTDIQYSIEEKRLSNGTEAKQPAFDAAMTMLDNAGIPVEMLSDEAMRQMAEKTNALETVSSQDEYQQTVVSSASSAKVINNLDNLAKFLENEPKTKEKTFLGALAKALDAKKHGSNSQYATFETKNGAIVTIRLANHNAATSTFDNHGEDNGISIVISAKENTGINNDGNAHVTEFYYDAIKLRKAEGKPLAEIVKSIKQTLYSGEYKDTTGLAQVQEVNTDSVPELMTVYHGSGARNYVIFNEDDAKITDRIDFLRNGDVVYGAAVGGKILLNADRLNPNTPIHEYTHLWDKACQQKNPELWKRGVELMKQTSLWKEVENDPNYAGLNEDGIASEVHSRLSGDNGEAVLTRMSQEIIDEGGSPIDMAAKFSVISRLKKWLSDFWHWVKDTMIPWSREEAERISVDDFVNMPLSDLAKGTKLSGKSETETERIVREAKADGTYMKAPNGRPSNLDESQWAQVRTKAFKAWFGDWEKSARIEKLRDSKPASISGKEIPISYDFRQNKKNALEYGKGLQGSYVNKDTGASIQLQRGRKNGGLHEVLQHNYKDREHIQSIAAIPQIIENSIYIDSEANKDIAKNPSVTEYQHYVCGLNIGGTDYTVLATVAVDKDGSRYYDHNLTRIEKGKLLDQIKGQAVNRESFDAMSGTNPTTLSGKDKRLISILQTDSSKAVDENGEPKVLYHGGPYRFSRFDTSRLGQSTGAESAKEGFFFTDSRDLAERFAENSIDELPTADVEKLVEERLSGMEGTELDDAYRAYRNDSGSYQDYMDETGRADDVEFLRDYSGAYEDGMTDDEVKRAFVMNEITEKIENGYFGDMQEVTEELSALGVEFGNTEAVFLDLRAPVVDDVKRDYFHEGESASPMTPTLKKAKSEGGDGAVFTSITEYGQKSPAAQYVVFSPNQIKSATDNLGEFSVENEDIRFQFAGEKGAGQMDRRDKSTMRLDNLAVARQMEGAGKDASAIKLATGWERGVDGKWRYEIPDLRLRPNESFERLYYEYAYYGSVYKEIREADLKDSPDYALYQRLQDKMNSIVDKQDEDAGILSYEEYERLEEQWNKANDEATRIEEKYGLIIPAFKLSEIIKAPELFKAYPSLRYYSVHTGDTQNPGAYAECDADDMTITINPYVIGRRQDKLERILVHEIQHAIQEIEGFALGGGPLQFELLFKEAKDELHARAYAHALEETAKGLGDARNQADAQKALIEEYRVSGLPLPDEETRTKGFNYFVRGYPDRSKDAVIRHFRLDESTRPDFDSYKEYMHVAGEVEARNASRRFDMDQIERRSTLASETEDVAREEQIDIGDLFDEKHAYSASIVTDRKERERLESEPTIKVYRAMQLVDGKLYPPMSGKVNGKWRDGISVEDLGKVWEKAEENPELADDKGRFVLNKGNGTTLKARYNPYIHTSTTPLNDQFSSAQSRPELVTVEVEIPKSELTSGYKADKAKDRVGKVEWKAGVIQSKLSGTRTVILSRWDKPMRIVPESEVADKIVEMFDGKDVTMPSNVVTPALRAELEKRGVPFVETDNQGRIKAEEQDVVDMLYDEEMEASNEIFNKELQLQIKGKLPSDHIYRMGQPGRILLSTGVPDLPIQMNASRLKTKATSYGHDFELSEIKDLVKALQTPLAVFAYGDKSKAQNIIVPLQKDGKNFIVGLSLNPTVGGRSLEINSIRNVFPKNNYEWLNWISQGKALYLNKEKVQTLINQQRTILADVEYLDLNSVANIVKSFENPRVSSGNVAEKGDILPDDTRFRIVGGNSGYVGYSMSKRAAEAKEKGRFPKTQFVKEYGVPASHLDALVEAGIISNDEWHHTSKFGNKTTFYSWSDDVYQQAYNTNKDSINELAKQYNEADSLAKRREIASEIYDVIEHTDEVVAYREQEAKEYEERRNRVKWELTQRRELETQKKNELSHAREVMSGLSDKDEHIRKTANGYWYNADNQVSLQLSDDGRILNIRYPANTDNSQKKGLRNVAEKAFGDAYKTEEELLKGAAGDNAEESNRTLFSVAESSNEREKITESYNGLQMLGDEQCLQLLLKTFSALPESTRAKITKLAPANGYRFDKAVADYYSQLAQKETLTEEELQDVRTIRDIMKTALGVRHLSMDEVLWSLYNTANKGKRGFLAIANRTLVADKLGFLPEDTRRRDDVKNGVRFSIIEDAHSASAAQMYNKATSYWKNRLKESFVDMNESINDLVSAIEIATGENAKSFEDVRLALNQMSSKGLNRMTRYTSEYLEPMWGAIKDIMSATGMTYEDVVRYVMLKHAVERNDVFARRDARRFYQDEFDKSSEPLFRKKAEKVKMRRRAMVAGDLNAAMALDVEINSIEAQLQSLKQSLDRHLVMVDNGTAAKYKEFRENDYGGLTSMYSSYPGLGSRANYASEEEYNAAARKVRKPKYSNVADMETAARDEVSLFESKAAAAQFKNLWDRINAATKTILENQYKSNVLSKEQYEYARDEFNYYIPLRGFADTEADDIWSYFGASQAGNFAPALVSAMGRKSEAENPFNWIGTMASSAIAQNVKNEAKLALYYFITNRPNQDLATIGKVWYQLDPAATAAYAANNPNNPKKIFVPVFPTFTSGLDDVAMKAAYSQWEADMKTKAQKGEAYQRNNKLNVRSDVAFVNPHEENEHVIRVKVRGEDKVIYVNGNPRAAQAVNGLLNLERQGDYQKLFGPVLRWMSAVNTSYNPEFWISNFQRDFLFSLMSSTISGEGARSLLNGYINPRKMMKMLRDYEDDKLGNGKIESYYREFAEGGGITGYSVVNGNEVWEKEIKKYLEPSTASKILKSLKLDKCLKFFNDLGESVEQMSRFAAFVSARESGKSIVDAVAAAKEITVNFNRKGSGKSISWEDTSKLRDKEGKPLNASQRFAVFTFGLVSPYGRRTIMFFNAAIQGLNALYRLWQKDKRKTGAWFAGYFAVGAMMAILHAIGDDDDDYLDIPDYTRRSNVLLGGGGVYFKWAMPQEARAAYAIGDMVVNHALGRNPNKNIFVEAGNAIADVLPLSTNEGISGLLPSVAQPFWDLYTNEDYTGASIYNDQKFLSDAERASRPHYKSPKVQTGRLFINTSEMLNAISGGDEYSAGAINAYPESMQHVIESFGGGLLTTVNKTAETIGGLVDAIAGEEVIGQDLSVRRFPFLNRLLVVNDERSRNSHISDLFYYYKDIADVAEDKMRQMRKSNDYDALNAYQDSEDYEVYLIFRRFNKLLKRYDDLLKSEDDKDERKRLIREQDELRRELINEISQIQ